MTQVKRPAIESSADVDPSATIGLRTHVEHLAQVCAGARIGRECTVGRGVYVGPGVAIGDRCKLENQALVYEPSVVEDGVYIGPSVVLTNDYFPRAVEPDGRVRHGQPWAALGVTVHEGASLGARAVCIAPVEIGRWATVAAGSVVTHDVPDFALVAGVPARRIRWVGHAGVPLETLWAGRYRCPVTDRRYIEKDGVLREETPDEASEDAPADLS